VATPQGLSAQERALAPRAFQKKRPDNLRQMIAVSTPEMVSVVVYEADGSSTASEYPVEMFLIAGEMPRPAS